MSYVSKIIPYIPVQTIRIIKTAQYLSSLVSKGDRFRYFNAFLNELNAYYCALLKYNLKKIDLGNDYNEAILIDNSAHIIIYDTVTRQVANPGIRVDFSEEAIEAYLPEIFTIKEIHSEVFRRLSKSVVTQFSLGRKKDQELTDIIADFFRNQYNEMDEMFQEISDEITPESKDKEREFEELTNDLNKYLPIPVSLHENFIIEAKQQGIRFGDKKGMIATGAAYVSGADSILCQIVKNRKELLVAPLAALILNDNHPMKERVEQFKAYKNSEYSQDSGIIVSST